VPSRVQPGARITAIGPKGERQLLEVTGRQMVTPEMADQLAEVERWTPDFLVITSTKLVAVNLSKLHIKQFDHGRR
jgi:hypothetical protein